MDKKASEMARLKELYKSPFLFALLRYLEIFPVGIIISLIAALILRRRPPKTDLGVAG
jgi:hypothetical protein